MICGAEAGIFIYELLFGLIVNQNRFNIIPIKPTEALTWSFKNFFRNMFLSGLSLSLLGALAGFLVSGLEINLLLEIFLIILLPTGLIGGIVGGFNSIKIKNKTYSNQGIWNSFKNGIAYGIVGLLLGGTAFGLCFWHYNSLILMLVLVYWGEG